MNRAFVYGDLLFETIRIDNGLINHASRHFKRLCESSALLNMQLSADFTLPEFEAQIQKAIHETGMGHKTARVRYLLHRDSEGFYLPNKNKVAFHIDVFALDETPNQEKKLGVYTHQKKARGPFANIKSGSALLYVMASIWAKENGFDDALILNQDGRPVESSNSNLFWIKNNKTFTPPLHEGCVAGVMRSVILEQQEITEKECRLDELKNADEIFLSNAVSGITKAHLVLP